MRRRLPLLLWILAVAAMLPAAAINASQDWGESLDLVANVEFTLLILGAATTGAVVATRVPANTIGWTLLALGARRGRPRHAPERAGGCRRPDSPARARDAVAEVVTMAGRSGGRLVVTIDHKEEP